MRIAAYGMAVDLPRRWEGRIFRRPETMPTLHAGNFALPQEDGDFGAEAVARMRDGDAFLAITEFKPELAGEPLFSYKGLPQHLHTDDASNRTLQRRLPGLAGIQRFFHTGGRAFCLYVVVWASSAHACMDAVNRVLSSVEIAHRGTGG